MRLPVLPTLAGMLLLGLALLGGGWMAWQAAEHDLARSTLTRAEVIAVRPAPEDGLHAVRLRFTAADGRVVEASPRMETRWPPRVGETWDVRYDPAAPERVWADAFLGTWFLPMLLGGIGGVGLIVAGGLAALAFRRTG